MYLVVRYSAGGGEWWDNNDGKNYRVQFCKGMFSHMLQFKIPTFTQPVPLRLQIPRQFPSQP
ncbi:hypothetical protein BDZ89DRAFT_1060648 [Hymenopellis radicata]|nr:hypothetical protein BDZ89DRAFT_1060648 [Hymenopellis radicata]